MIFMPPLNMFMFPTMFFSKQLLILFWMIFMTCNIIVTWHFITQTLRTKYEQTQVYDESSFPQGLEPNPQYMSQP